jgi:signal transduction histidine kinase
VQLIHTTPLLLKSDQQLLFIVISNLLENACKYSAPETPIRVEALPATPTTPQLQLVISNTVGRAGWPDKDKLFSKYYRTPGAQRQAGTGLGLFLVRNLLLKLGGQVYFAPQGEEVRFVVLLPSVDAS